MTCGSCNKQISVNSKGFPVSHYWKGKPDFVEIPYCSAKCSLEAYEILRIKL